MLLRGVARVALVTETEDACVQNERVTLHLNQNPNEPMCAVSDAQVIPGHKVVGNSSRLL
jgi:hypothetical protein